MTYLNVKFQDVPATGLTQSIDFVDWMPDLVDLEMIRCNLARPNRDSETIRFVVAAVAPSMHCAAHGARAANDFEYAVAGLTTVHAQHCRQHSDEVEIAADQKRSMICDSELNGSVDLSFVIVAIVVGCRASNGLELVRLPYAVDTMHSDPFGHGRSQRVGSVVPVDVVASLPLDRSPDTMFGHLVVVAVHPDTSDALYFVNNAVAVIVVVSAVVAVIVAAVDHRQRQQRRRPQLVVASSYPVAMEIAFSVVLVAVDTVTCADDRRPFGVGIVAQPVDDHSPLPMDTVMVVHWSVHPNRLNHLNRPHVDRPCHTYCRPAIDTWDTVIAVAIVVAMGVVLGVEHRHLAVPSDVPQLQTHHIDSTHLC